MIKQRGFWDNKNVLVTGCYGFLASWLTTELVKRGANVSGLSQDVQPKSLLCFNGMDQKINLVRGSITDYLSMKRIFNEYEIQYCFHLAALTTVSQCNQSPMDAFEANTRGTWVLLECARETPGFQGFIMASSDKAYGSQPKLPYDETQTLLARFPYDVSKMCAELAAQSYCQSYGVPIGITRCANIYGGGDLHLSRIVPGTICSLLLNESPVLRSDGTPLRDFIYAEDAVNAYLTLAENIHREGVKGEAFNFTGQSPTRMIDLVNLIIRLTGKHRIKPQILGKGKPKGEIDDQYLSYDKAKRTLGWKPKVTLEQGLKTTIQWYKNYLKFT